MEIPSAVYGHFDIDPNRIITFPQGLLGLPEYKRWALVSPNADAAFYYLVSVDSQDTILVVAEAGQLIDGYKVPIDETQAQELGIRTFDDAVVFVTLNRQDGKLTANLAGPLVINSRTLTGRQFALPLDRYSTREDVILRRRPARKAA